MVKKLIWIWNDPSVNSKIQIIHLNYPIFAIRFMLPTVKDSMIDRKNPGVSRKSDPEYPVRTNFSFFQPMHNNIIIIIYGKIRRL